MAAGPFTLFDSFKEKLGNGLIDLDTSAFRMTLHGAGYTPSGTDHAVFADTSNELATANGYTAGGAVLTASWTRIGASCSFTCDPVSWLASGTGLTARVAVIHAVRSVSDNPLVGYVLLDASGAAVAVTAGNTLTITPHPNGLFTLT
ncbi:hypothetical protein [Hyphomonas sp.]|uniref:hypothetical protein n=1 Tax=Hyphomonas sp. TaxID=87 RepID=UPI0025B8ACF4|nr:hypothetical protein [Hyphomonas sp.]